MTYASPAGEGSNDATKTDRADRFVEDREALLRERVGIILFLGWAFVPLFAFADYFLYPQHFSRFLIYRFIAAACCSILYMCNRRWDLGFRSFYLGISAAYIVGITIIAMILKTGGYSTPYYAGLILVFLGMSTVLTVPVGRLIIHSVILYLIYLFSVLLFAEDSNMGLFTANNMFILSTCAVGLIASHIGYRSRLREYRLRRELQDAQTELQRYSTGLRQLVDESEKKYQVLVDNAHEAIFILQDNAIQFPNPRTAELLGFPASELARKPFIDFLHEEDRHAVLNQDRPASDVKGIVTSSTFRLVKPSKEVVWVDMNAVSIEWSDRPGFLVFLRDVTERKVMEAELIQAQKMEAIGTLAGGIAHDFNNLLTGILGYASLMLLNKDSSDPHYEQLRNIEHLVQSGADLTRQLLGFARGGKYEVKPTDLNELVQKSSEMFGHTRQEITIHRRFEKSIRPVEVDRGQVEQVLLNLYVNAGQAMPEGGYLYLETMSVSLDTVQAKHHSAKPGDYVRIMVRDTGIGMDPETQKRIFEPFFTTKEMGRGIGLGLASAYGIVKNHGGFIDVFSEIGKGTAFNVYFPVSSKEVVTEELPRPVVTRQTGTILLIDDQAMILKVGKDMLEALGYKVITAGGGREAVAIYTEKRDTVDLVILDMIMPSMSGGDTYDLLKAIEPGVRVILSSGYSINGQASRIIERGCNGFIQKPFNMTELSEKIQEVLEENKTR